MTCTKYFLSLFICSLICISIQSVAQSQNNSVTEHKIEVIGFAKQEVEPNQIYIKVQLKEYFKSKQKITVEAQAKKMQDGLKAIGITEDRIKLSYGSAAYQRVKLFKKDVVAQKTYEVLAKSRTEVDKIFKVLEAIQITTAYVNKVNHSELETIKDSLAIVAVKNAKANAKNMVNALGAQLGKPILIHEIEPNSNAVPRNHIGIRGSRSTIKNEFITASDIENLVSYKPILIKKYIHVSFLIE